MTGGGRKLTGALRLSLLWQVFHTMAVHPGEEVRSCFIKAPLLSLKSLLTIVQRPCRALWFWVNLLINSPGP